MNLNEIRNEIDKTDDEILQLFIKRMELCGRVADYKREHNMPVSQKGREKALLTRLKKQAEDSGLLSETDALFTELIDISCACQHGKNSGTQPVEPNSQGKIVVFVKLADSRGLLRRLLTRFYLAGVNITGINGMALPDHTAQFFIEFEPGENADTVSAMLASLKADTKDFGDYRILPEDTAAF